ncbi:MAG TPA: hypothetical protein VFP53_00490 [Sphingomicrobium sp.]|nr:hypothetical protein [Sphingomicrobium sp.]
MKALILAALATGALAASADARPTDTIGYCISDGFYGNEPNLIDPYAPGGPSNQAPGTVAGRVVPSQSPGPFVNNPTDPDNPFRGSSLGDYHELFAGSGFADFCSPQG